MIKFQKFHLIFILCFLFINISFAKEIFTANFERKTDTITKKPLDDFFCIMSSKKYIPGRKILDDSFKVPEGSKIIVVEPQTNHMVLFDKPLYHAVEAVENIDVVKHRVALMFSAWDKVPRIYADHLHWTNHMISFPGGPSHQPKDVEFRLTI